MRRSPCASSTLVQAACPVATPLCHSALASLCCTQRLTLALLRVSGRPCKRPAASASARLLLCALFTDSRLPVGIADCGMKAGSSVHDVWPASPCCPNPSTAVPAHPPLLARAVKPCLLILLVALALGSAAGELVLGQMPPATAAKSGPRGSSAPLRHVLAASRLLVHPKIALNACRRTSAQVQEAGQ